MLYEHAYHVDTEEGSAMNRGMMVRRMLAVFVIGVMVLAGVASGQSLTVQVSKKEGIGAFITDAKGMALYIFKKDMPGGASAPGRALKNGRSFTARTSRRPSASRPRTSARSPAMTAGSRRRTRGCRCIIFPVTRTPATRTARASITSGMLLFREVHMPRAKSSLSCGHCFETVSGNQGAGTKTRRK